MFFVKKNTYFSRENLKLCYKTFLKVIPSVLYAFIMAYWAYHVL